MLKDMMNNYGYKVHKAGVTMHSMVPTMKDLKIQGGTNIETVSFSDSPYLEIFKDTTQLYNQFSAVKTTALKDWLQKPPTSKSKQYRRKL